jgi:hypothetical protein
VWKNCVAWCVVLGGGLLALSPNASAGPDQAKKNKEFYEGRSTQSKRTCGVLLKGEVSVAAKPGAGDEIQIEWILDYTGPRPPLIILEPSLEKKTSGQTTAIFYAEGKDQKIYEFRLESPAPMILGGGDGSFLTVEKGKTATGKLKVSANLLLGDYKTHWPKAFAAGTPAVLHVQLLHKPYLRGNDLDAWTGELYTAVLKVPLKKW